MAGPTTPLPLPEQHQLLRFNAPHFPCLFGGVGDAPSTAMDM
ncbi:hypothetical protein CGLO_04923 [Colletotrichum gloeosporioides Cg-14]|uniref:Uncharacterized protein n=1 Tax=Colletotrichum gloeosporioides (strain Cg-14) TaxID=1237896 RepID=T0M326_COLGC|nr:hypothetical protein CGLO_04923 [Colletotrichum gloeosporioides Cg-14]